MMESKKYPRLSIDPISIIIVIAIALCMIFLINYTYGKYDEITTASDEALLIKENFVNGVKESEFASEIANFKPEACKMIEIYDEDFQTMLKIQFRENESVKEDDIITAYPNLIELLQSSEEGYTNLEIDGYDEDIYFQWTTTSTGQRCIMIIYMSKHIVKNLWIFPFICYLVLLLVFILVIRIHLAWHKREVEYYKIMSERVQERLIK